MPPRTFGPKKQGPDLSWADEDLEDPNDRSNRAVSPPSNEPGPTFPPRNHRNIIRTPKPLSQSEKRAVDAQLRFRARCREGPLFTVLDKSSLLVEGVKARDVRRRGFDPFEGQERYSTRHVKRRRTEPDLKERGRYGYSLNVFPPELWGLLDPEQRLKEYWDGLPEDSAAVASLGKKVVRKKRRRQRVSLEGLQHGAEAKIQDESDDEDPIRRGRRKKGRQEVRARGERSGLEAEDEYNLDERVEESEESDEGDPQDSEFSSDSAAGDYDAELYFDAGEDDDMADEGGEVTTIELSQV